MSSPISRGPSCEVFLSFRGTDTRNNFADFLYVTLRSAGLDVFKDEEALNKGEEISPQLIRAIEQSKISIPIISVDYASSKSCLMELEQMVECMDRKNHTIIPIFYHVDPSDVRNCRGTFAMADEHQKRALRQIGNLAGHHLVKRSDKSPSNVIKQIVREVEQKLGKRDLIVPEILIGVDPHVQEIMAKLKVNYHDGKAFNPRDTCEKVLIYGIPGVGKTALGKHVYNQLHHLYGASSFLENIQEHVRAHGILSAQNKLITDLQKEFTRPFHCSDRALKYIQDRFHAMKVLVLFDDVKDREQLSALVGELDSLGQGSRVIVTSQRADVLIKLEGAESFGLRTMHKDKALQLFSRHAFKRDSPPKEFGELSTKIVAAIDGLPLALENVGKFLSGEENKNVWTEKLFALEEAPEKNVQTALFKSFNTLEYNEQRTFLHIAYSSGMDKRIPYYQWNDPQRFPTTTIRSLCALSLVEIGENKEPCMPGILKTFGRAIVENEDKKEPCSRCSLFNPKEAPDVPIRRKVTFVSTEPFSSLAAN